MRWNIRRGGRAWTGAEFRSRIELLPEKLELFRDKLLDAQDPR